MARALLLGMNADDLMNETLKGSTVDRARAFLESCASSTEALRALMAAMCELDQIKEATVLEAVLPAVAAIESENM